MNRNVVLLLYIVFSIFKLMKFLYFMSLLLNVYGLNGRVIILKEKLKQTKGFTAFCGFSFRFIEQQHVAMMSR
jgi:hypothetical protein